MTFHASLKELAPYPSGLGLLLIIIFNIALINLVGV